MIPPLAATKTRARRMSPARPFVPRAASIPSSGQKTHAPEVDGVTADGLFEAADHSGTSSAARTENQYRLEARNPEIVTTSVEPAGPGKAIS
jgi:hypothetical protein